MIRVIVAILLCVGCKGVVEDVAPPISGGKCVVDKFTGSRATVQVCLWSGYAWQCDARDCTRVGEPAGERTAPEPAK